MAIEIVQLLRGVLMIKMTGEVNREHIDRVCTAAAVNYFLPAERDQAVMWIVDGL